MKKFDLLIIFVLFYAGWFGAVFLAKTNNSLWTLAFPVVLVGFQLVRGYLSKRNIFLAISIAWIGVIFDTAALRFELITAIGAFEFLAPIWLISIWLLYSFSMLVFSRKIGIPIWMMAVLGFIVGPLSYKSGEIFEVLKFETPWAIAIYAIFWAAFFPVSVVLSKRVV